MSSFFGRKTHLKKNLKKRHCCWKKRRGEGRIGPWHARSRMWGRDGRCINAAAATAAFADYVDAGAVAVAAADAAAAATTK